MNGGRVDDEAENVGDRVGVDERGWPVLVCGDGREFSLESVEMLSCFAGNIWKKFMPLADEMAWYR